MQDHKWNINLIFQTVFFFLILSDFISNFI